MKKVIIGTCIVFICALLKPSIFAVILAIFGFIIFIQGAIKVVEKLAEDDFNRKYKN